MHYHRSSVITDFSSHTHEIPDDGIIGILYNKENLENGNLLLSWNVIGDDNTKNLKYRLYVLDKNANETFDSGIISSTSLELEENSYDSVAIELYNDNEYLGNALFLQL